MKRAHKWIVIGEEAGVMAEYCERCGLTSEEWDGETMCDESDHETQDETP